MKTEKRYTTTRAAKLLGLSSSTVLRAIKCDMLKAWRTPGGHYRLSVGDVELYKLSLTLPAK